MTRESRARWLAFITAAVVVLLAALFSVLRNLPAPAQPAAAAVSAPDVVAKAVVKPAAESLAPASAAASAPAATAGPDRAPAIGAPAAEAASASDPERIATGARAYARLGCATCHSIEGRGRPSSPLDGVGSRLDRQALLEFTTGTGAARDALGAGLVRRKERAADDADFEALIDYLAQLK
jgi:mono/diheme cytochrome c family protein